MMRIRLGCFALAVFGCSSPMSGGVGDGSASPLVDASAKDAGYSAAVDAPAEAVDAPAEAEAMPLPDAAACDRELPTCPPAPPSYQRDVAPIITRECAACHYTGSTIARGVYSTYAQLQAGRGSVLNEVFACKMPVAPVPPLSPDDRTTLLTWIECGGPNN
jgi:hypothetical protein